MKVVVAEKAWSDLDSALAIVLDRFGPVVAHRVERDVMEAIRSRSIRGEVRSNHGLNTLAWGTVG